jgi:NADPH:quinone reductase-like Zn-dependent oxidoreductase
VINYRARPDWHLDVRRLTGGQGVDHVVEVGGAGTLAKSFQAAAIGGEVVWIGMLSSGEPTIDGNVIYNSGASLRVIAVGSRAQFVAMNRCISVNRLKPIIDRVFEFNEAGRAFAYYEAGDHFGKVVVRVGQ